MTEQNIWIIVVGGLMVLAIWIWILIEILRFSTREIRRNSESQVKLLIELLKAQGVQQGTIDELLSVKETPHAGL